MKGMAALGNQTPGSVLDFSEAVHAKSTPYKAAAFRSRGKKLEIWGGVARSSFLPPIKAVEPSANSKGKQARSSSAGDVLSNDCGGFSGESRLRVSTVGNSSNIVWHKCSIEKSDRQELLNQKGCVIWITGLSGSVIEAKYWTTVAFTAIGKSTLACALSCALHSMGKLTYILDGDNCRHGLNQDLSFKADDSREHKKDRKERDACRALLSEGDFIEVYMDVPLQICEERDPKGLYKLARAGKIKGFTGVDDPYEPPLNCEIVLHQREGVCDSPTVLAEKVISYLEGNRYLEA
ncbi:UNVERIFIED_CONTAM: Adenylyl-sulfate kinase, chloroplastic [Sesamum angustifolium]|uniref:Adenylyl-sulfate kinase, chloroplastic n=1 Tax=Sesamum angustifolium TaxID=2727405 RepID=A0AAW2RN42_9LAMI